MRYQKTFITLYTLVISLMLVIATSTSQGGILNNISYTLAGTVVDADMQTGIEGVDVTINDNNQSTLTDEYGTFIFSDIEAGIYSITVSADGYNTVNEEVEVTELGATVEIRLEREANEQPF